jgi:hypothetical protein
VICETGVIVSHPDPRFDFAERVARARDLPPRNMADDAVWSALAQRFRGEGSGAGAAIDPSRSERRANSATPNFNASSRAEASAWSGLLRPRHIL